LKQCLRNGVAQQSWPLCRLTDKEDRQWLIHYVKEVTRERLNLDFDTIFKHLMGTSNGGVGLDELRTIFFGDYMDTASEEPAQRVYDEVKVNFHHLFMWIGFLSSL
jgi:hypothetical protein